MALTTVVSVVTLVVLALKTVETVQVVTLMTGTPVQDVEPSPMTGAAETPAQALQIAQVICDMAHVRTLLLPGDLKSLVADEEALQQLALNTVEEL